MSGGRLPARKVIIALVAVAGLAGALLGLVWWGQEKLVFFPQLAPRSDVAGVDRIEYTAADGQQLFAYVIGRAPDARGALLCFHGNAEIAAQRIMWAVEVNARTRYTVVLAEYRGYAELGGKPTYAGTLLDAKAAYAAMRVQLSVDSAHVAFFGYSLGSAVAAELALKHEPGALLLQAPFTSARDMTARFVTPIMAPAFNMVSRIRFDTRAAVASIAAPVWVVHGTADDVIGVAMGRDVFAAAKHKGELLILNGAGHSNLAQRDGVAYWTWIEKALK